MNQTIRSQAQEILRVKAENQWLKEQVGLAVHRAYGASSEKTPVGQEPLLFNEGEVCAAPEVPEPTKETITYTRRKPGQRDELVASLPIEEIVYDLPENERVCPQCSGCLHEMGADVREEIKIVPATTTLVRHRRIKYACRNCQINEIKTPILTAPMPRPAFPKSLASPTAASYIMYRKFVEGVPLYRQEQGLRRQGLNLSRQTMANWMIAAAVWLEAIYLRMKDHLLKRDILHADETTLQVLKEEGRAAQTKSYMWLYRSGRDGPAIVLYEYQPTRGGLHPRAFLKGFHGFLQVDGYIAYDGISDVVLVGCWAHARRKFMEAIDVIPKKLRSTCKTSAHEGLRFCNTLFRIERDLRDVTPEERFAGRNLRSRPIVDELRVWLDKMTVSVLPKSVFAESVTYCLNQWPKLTAFLLEGRLELDNNRAERAIRPFVMGRKNWLFANTPRGARSSATIYSVIETAKENGLNPLTYLTYLFQQLPNIDVTDGAAVDLLLPWSDSVQAKFHVPEKSGPTSNPNSTRRRKR